MKLAFALPHTLELPAITAKWEFAVTGPQQAAMVKRADELGYDMVAVPEHFVVPHSHLGLSGPHYLHSTGARAVSAGAAGAPPPAWGWCGTRRNSTSSGCRFTSAGGWPTSIWPR